MGLLDEGIPLPWAETKPLADKIRKDGIEQFLNIWRRLKDRHGDELLWGDELEYMVISLDHEGKDARLSLRQTEILAKLSAKVHEIKCDSSSADSPAVPVFHPEYGRYMLESTPGAPYTGSITDLVAVESNMRYRRSLARKHLKSNEIPLTFTSFPRLGVQGQFTEPYADPAGAVSSHSLFLPEEITNPHPRFPTLTSNIRTRRGSKVAINLPIYFDDNTPKPFIDPSIPWDRSIYPEDSEAKAGAAKPDHIYLDAMGFGMGCCCLQLTFQACNVEDAKRMYDGLTPIGPILLALTGASPIWRGYLADVDCRWNVIAGSVDDRTEEERGLKPLKDNKYLIPKSRYDSVDLYLSSHWMNRPEYNDTDVPYDKEICQELQRNGVDELLAKHIAHLFIRDPLVIFSDRIDIDNTTANAHFENLQSTNWQTLRFKPPPPDSPIGWRVEFRSMEVQMTDFENAAFACFVVLLSRALLSFHMNFYIPISKVDENMSRAQVRDAAVNSKFFFRKNIQPYNSSPSTPVSGVSASNFHKSKKMNNCFSPLPRPTAAEDISSGPVEEEYEEMTLNEIMNGKGERVGLLGLATAYLETLDVEPEPLKKIHSYLDFIRKRSKGELLTPAAWIRNFVRSHPAYKHDSVVSAEINYDLMVAVDEIERGVRRADDLLPKDYTGGDADEGSIGI